MTKIKKKSFWNGINLSIIFFGTLIIIELIFLFIQAPEKISYSDFLKEIDRNNIQKLLIKSKEHYVVWLDDGRKLKGYFPLELNEEPSLSHFLEKGIEVEFKKFNFNLTPPLIALLITIGVFCVLLFIKSIDDDPILVESENKYRFTLFGSGKEVKFKESEKTTFKDVGGLTSVKNKCKFIIDYLQDKKSSSENGAKMPKGILLTGPPGTGKTLLAKAIAGEAGVPFLYLSASQIIELYVGIGPRRIRDLYESAKKNSPCIIFLDEIDAIGKSRSKITDSSSGNEMERTLNQLLSCLDGVDDYADVITIAATNRIEVLDDALTRKGRFDYQIPVEPEGLADRSAIFKIHTKDKKISENILLEKLISKMSSFSGADIEFVCNQAAINSYQEGTNFIHESHFVLAIDDLLTQRNLKFSLDKKLNESRSKLVYLPMDKKFEILTIDNKTYESSINWIGPEFISIKEKNKEKPLVMYKHRLVHIKEI